MLVVMRALLLGIVVFGTTTASATAASLPFIADDYEHARAEATARKLPLFVEVWAPW